MKRLSRKTPAFALFIVFVLPFLVILYLLISEINTGIRFGDRERLGLEYIIRVRGFAEKLQQHRAAMADGPGDGAAMKKVKREVNEATSRLDGHRSVPSGANFRASLRRNYRTERRMMIW